MKIKKLKISELKVSSFITTNEEKSLIIGGDRITRTMGSMCTYEITKRVVDGGCWASELTGPKQPIDNIQN